MRVQAAASSILAQASYSTLEEAVLEFAYTNLAVVNHEDDLAQRDPRVQNRPPALAARCLRYFRSSSSSCFRFSLPYSAATLHQRVPA